MARHRSCSVLVVDDAHDVRAMVRSLFAAHPQVDVDEAESGDAAIAALDAEPYDVVVMDLHMPGMDGLETTRAIRARGHSVPVVAFTASPDPAIRSRFADAGAQEHVPKTRVEELAAYVVGLGAAPRA